MPEGGTVLYHHSVAFLVRLQRLPSGVPRLVISAVSWDGGTCGDTSQNEILSFPEAEHHNFDVDQPCLPSIGFAWNQSLAQLIGMSTVAARKCNQRYNSTFSLAIHRDSRRSPVL
jgi:hypothetical protein